MTDAATTTDDLEADETESYIDFRRSGGMHVVIEGNKKRLRSPRMRDYRHLVDLWRDEIEGLEEKSQELQDFLERATTAMQERLDSGEDNRTPEQRAEERSIDRRLSNDIRVVREDASLRWWAEVVRTLGVTDTDKEIDPDDLPVFCTTVESINQTLEHWRSVPSRSGAR